MKKYGILLFLVLLHTSLFAQSDSILVHIDGQPETLQDFERLFSKNTGIMNDSDQDPLDQNIQLYIDYKLKLREAKEQGLDTLHSIQKKYEVRKSQLADKYLLDTKVSQALLKEAYHRTKYERDISYILIKVPDNASPEDTLKAYNKALTFKSKVEAGGDFETLAQKYSEDPSVKTNKGHFGWLSAFQTVYPFENAAYNTKVGELSDPFRSAYGYHLLRVNAEQESRGTLRISQIMIKFKKGENREKAEDRINKIYKKLKNGASFEDMAHQYSDDENTAKIGGRMKPFTRGDIQSPTFDKIAFSLTEENPLSEPVKSKTGWHILKFISATPIGSFDQEKKGIRDRIKRNSRSKLVKDSLYVQLEKKYSQTITSPGLDYFTSKLGDNFLELAAKDLPQKAMVQTEKESSFTYTDFFTLLEKSQKYRRIRLTPSLLDELFKEHKKQALYEYEKNHLAEKCPTYTHDIADFKNELMVYELMQKNVWNKAEDTLGLENFYSTHKEDYKTSPKYAVTIISSDRKKTIRKARKALQKGIASKEIEAQYPEVMVVSDTLAEGHTQLPQNIKKSPGISKIHYQNGVYMVAETLAYYPSRTASFNAVKGKVTNDYQIYLEKDFIASLHKKYKVELNDTLIETLKQNN